VTSKRDTHRSKEPPRNPGVRLATLFAGVFGGFFGLCLLKFGDPPIMEQWVTAPKNAYQVVLGNPWPIAWAYWLLGGLAVLGLFSARWRLKTPWWLAAMPLVWLCWQFVSSTHTLSLDLTKPTLAHFVAATLCFYLGLFALSRSESLRPFLLGVLAGFVIMTATGWSQHFGGLAETRRYFFAYLYPKMSHVPPELLKKMSSDRIFATVFYPNAFAGAVLLLLAPMLATVWGLKQWFTRGARMFLVAVIAAGGLACLYWSGSKGGWLLMLLMGLVVLLHLRVPARLKVACVSLVLLAGLAGFFWKYAAFFERGATSVGARFDYWHAAIETALAHPILGTGPGTFGPSYARIKRPESEPTRLAHNDYLEQASDSGVVGFLAYTLFVIEALIWSYRRAVPGKSEPNWPSFCLWLGVAAWCLQSLFEFSLYIPATAWAAFAFLGWLLGGATRINRKSQI
jgi:O-antigen ligase